MISQNKTIKELDYECQIRNISIGFDRNKNFNKIIRGDYPVCY
jgi:hypothetical protein